MTYKVTDKHHHDDPATAMNEAARALAEERRLNVFLDRIIVEEKARTAASENIRSIWTEIRKAGFDVDGARRKLVWRSCAV